MVDRICLNPTPVALVILTVHLLLSLLVSLGPAPGAATPIRRADVSCYDAFRVLLETHILLPCHREIVTRVQ